MTAAIPRYARLGLTARSRVSPEALARATVTAGTATFAVYWAATAAVRWRNLQVGAFDFAFFDQIVWNTSQGRFFESSFVPYNFLGQHVEPVLLLFALGYRLGAGPWMLLLVQAAVCGLAALVLYEAARAMRLPAVVGAATALAYLANPYLHRALAFDFHPETMVALPAFGAAWAFAARRPGIGVACALSALLFKEDAAFVVLALAAFAWQAGAKRHSAILVACGLGWAAMAVLALMPYLRDGAPSDLVARYAGVLGGREGVAGLAWATAHPIEVARAVMTPGQLATAATFVSASGPWLLLAPMLAATLLPGLGLALLSSHPEQQALAFHYGAELVPIAAIAGLSGIRSLLRWAPSWVVAGGVVLAAAVALSVLGPVTAFAEDGPTPAHLAAVRGAVAAVDDQASVSAQSNLAARFAHRREVWEFPGHWEDARWVVVDRYGFRSSQSLDAGFEAALLSLPEQFQLVFEEDGVSVYKRSER